MENADTSESRRSAAEFGRACGELKSIASGEAIYLDMVEAARRKTGAPAGLGDFQIAHWAREVGVRSREHAAGVLKTMRDRRAIKVGLKARPKFKRAKGV
jgi:hypothetical protein